MWTDDEIIGAILAGGSIRPIVARLNFGSGFRPGDLRRRHANGPVCAVSAGLLFRGLTSSSEPLTAFARRFGVSEEVASGVSVGFETNVHWFEPPENFNSEFARGWAIGAAVRSAIEESSDV